jgi:mannose-6-phosphate isomerase-like protein (cupin superfamily)
VLILSDYAKGVFSRKLVQKIISSATRAGKPIIADFKPVNRSFFRGANIISPNLEEGRAMTGLSRVEDVGKRLAKDIRAHVVLTRGGEGISVFRYKGRKPAYHVPGKRIRMFDVAGAGDTVIATLALGIASGLELEAAAVLANEAGAITVQKPGTATLSLEELASAFKVSSHIESAKAIPKVWGNEKWLENNEKYCCKVLSVKKGYQCSLHYHKKKDETFVVTSGHIRLELGKEVLHLRPGAFIRIPPRTKHRFTGIEDSLIMEVSTHHDEADSYRLEKSRKIPRFR